tara:strand:- start:435 stop:731 length:297 start_codon:yes stop_codon:yes gene_type:complete
METLRNGYKLVLNHQGINNGVVLAMRLDDSKKEFVTWIAVDNNFDNLNHGNHFLLELGEKESIALDNAYQEAVEDYLARIKFSPDTDFMNIETLEGEK